MKQFLTSESVSSGHPDKICDQISDGILDECLKQDENSRVACEVMAAWENIILAWEISTKAVFDYEKVVRKIICEIWYDRDETYLNWNTVKIQNLINVQSPDIAQGVDTWWAGDQWIMYWFATNETKEFMPLPISLAHKIIKKLEEVRKNWVLDYLLPDAKTQVTIEYKNWIPLRIDTIVVSNQHKKNISQEELKKWIKEKVLNEVVWNLIDEKTIYHINPTWKFEIWGPIWDCGLTWRKIIIDTYWGIWRHWGWAFSWKDSSKVDRSWAYISRYLAKNIVASGLCEKCEMQISYWIWVKEPISIFIDTFWASKISEENIIKQIRENFDLSSWWIIKKLDLKKPWFRKTASFWHFWREEFSWEKLDSVKIFENLLK